MKILPQMSKAQAERTIERLNGILGYPKRAGRFNEVERGDDKGITSTVARPVEGKTEWGINADKIEGLLSSSERTVVKDVDLDGWKKVSVVALEI